MKKVNILKVENIVKEKKLESEFFNDYGPNKDLYYVINHPSPIEELKKF